MPTRQLSQDTTKKILSSFEIDILFFLKNLYNVAGHYTNEAYRMYSLRMVPTGNRKISFY